MSSGTILFYARNSHDFYCYRRLGVAYFIGPREADAQLAYLARSRLAQCVYSTDSDLLVHLLDCPHPVMWFRSVNRKLNICQTVNLELLRMQEVPAQLGAEPSLQSMIRADKSRMLLLDYALTAGCDYIKWKGIGMTKALCILRQLFSQGDVGKTEPLAR